MPSLIKLTGFFTLLSLAACSPTEDPGKGEELLAAADSLYRAGEYSAAVAPTMEALELARNADDHYLCGQAEDLLADIIAATYSGSEVIVHRLNAAGHYLSADSLHAHRYALLDVAIAHANNDSLTRSLTLIDSLLKSDSKDSALTANCLRTRMRINLKFGLPSDNGQLRQYRKFYTPTAADYACFAINESLSESRAGEIERVFPELAEEIRSQTIDYRLYLDSARYYALTGPEQQFVDWATAECYKNSGETDLWKSFTDSIHEKRLFDRTATRAEDVAGAQRDFESERAAGHHKEASRLRLMLMILCPLFVAVAAAGLVYYRLRMKVKNAEIDAKMESLANLSKEIASVRETTPDLSAKIESLFRERWQTINFLCNEFFEKGDSDKTRAFILNEVEKEIRRLKTPRKLRQIEASVDECMDSIVSRLREQCGDILKEDDILFITLIYAGFSPRAVCMFTGIKLKTFYTKRTRLVARISASEATDRNDFLHRLNTSL